jgi:hypothetical protein
MKAQYTVTIYMKAQYTCFKDRRRKTRHVEQICKQYRLKNAVQLRILVQDTSHETVKKATSYKTVKNIRARHKPQYRPKNAVQLRIFVQDTSHES